MTDQPITKNHSLGTLGPAKKTKQKSPDFVGNGHLTRDLLAFLTKQIGEEEKVPVRLAGWKHTGPYGPFLAIEISPRYERRVEPIESDPFADLV